MTAIASPTIEMMIPPVVKPQPPCAPPDALICPRALIDRMSPTIPQKNALMNPAIARPFGGFPAPPPVRICSSISLPPWFRRLCDRFKRGTRAGSSDAEVADRGEERLVERAVRRNHAAVLREGAAAREIEGIPHHVGHPSPRLLHDDRTARVVPDLLDVIGALGQPQVRLGLPARHDRVLGLAVEPHRLGRD